MYQRMYETRSVRPYYTISHLGIFGKPFKQLVGFQYKKTIYITSSEMNNSSYFDVAEMKKASHYFASYWENNNKVRLLLNQVRRGFTLATKAEHWAWKQSWKKRSTKQLLQDVNKFHDLLFSVFGTMIISQPQHVLPLEDKMQILLRPYGNKNELLRLATSFPGDLPWAGEEREIAKLYKKWTKLSKKSQDKALDAMVIKYGWFNEIEGDKPFTHGHYREKIKTYKMERLFKKTHINIPSNIAQLGKLIGELGYLRFWNRYHFMHVRYHLKQILGELVKRSGHPEFKYATVAEIVNFFQGETVALDEIATRKNGYVSYLKNGSTCIVTGNKAKKLALFVKRNSVPVSSVIIGTVANKGQSIGRVRIVSFSAKDYNQQVAKFKKGEILVTGMTRPQIVHLCQKAAAIITDEGGITSHAAVISRELDIPCIINTRNATTVLKTGDMIKVEADSKGIVKIIRKKI